MWICHASVIVSITLQSSQKDFYSSSGIMGKFSVLFDELRKKVFKWRTYMQTLCEISCENGNLAASSGGLHIF